MAKYYENETTFNFSFEQISQGFWQRYPNPFSMHVLTEDTICREIRNGKLYTKRLLTKTNHVPKWGERFFKAKFVSILEESIVDPKEKILVTYTRNIGFNKIMSVVEKVIYKTSNDNPDTTVALRSAWIDSQVYGFAKAIRAFGVERFKKNCHKTVLGFEYILHSMFPHHHATLSSNRDNMNLSAKAHKIKEAAKSASDHVKAQAEQIYQAYSVKN